MKIFKKILLGLLILLILEAVPLLRWAAIALFLWGFIGAAIESIFHPVPSPQKIICETGYDYERFVAQYLRDRGFRRVSVTKASGDYGVDVTAYKDGKKYAVQCKYYTGTVGVRAVQEVVAGKSLYNCDITMVVTNSEFTAAAKTLAKSNGVILLSRVRP